MEMNNRDEVEAQIMAMLLQGTEEQRRVLEPYLGWPPDVSRVPTTVLRDLQKKQEQQLYGILGTVFVMAAEQLQDHLDWYRSRPQLIEDAHRWAKVQAQQVARQTMQTRLDRISAAVQDAGVVPLPGVRPAAIPKPALDDLNDQLDKIFGESPSKTVAKTEVTQAVTAGEKATIDSFSSSTGKVMEAFWRHRAPKNKTHPCSICSRLENQPSFKWPEIFPTKPHLWNGPPAHPNCDCNVEWVELSKQQAAGYGMNFSRR